MTEKPNIDERPFIITFDGSILTVSIAIRSAREIDRLIRVLQAQKDAFIALQDDLEQPPVESDQRILDLRLQNFLALR